MDSFSALERTFFEQGGIQLAGVDEAGRGPLAGPVVACAVILPGDCRLEDVNDSKALSPSRRNKLSALIEEAAVSVGIGIADHTEIDEHNILRATILAMHRAIDALSVRPQLLLIDGNQFEHPSIPFTTVVRGDALCYSIAAASIIAKVRRDAIMTECEARYPAWRFSKHKGYPTAQHIAEIRQHGYSPIHRRSFLVKQLNDLHHIF